MQQDEQVLNIISVKLRQDVTGNMTVNRKAEKVDEIIYLQLRSAFCCIRLKIK